MIHSCMKETQEIKINKLEEAIVLEKLYIMACESLDPASFNKFCEIKNILIDVRNLNMGKESL